MRQCPPPFTDAPMPLMPCHGPTRPMTGINDPYIKLLVTGLNFFILYLLNVSKHTCTYVRVCMCMSTCSKHAAQLVRTATSPNTDTTSAYSLSDD